MWDSGTLLAISPYAGESILRPPLSRLHIKVYIMLLVVTLTGSKFGTKGRTDKYLVMSRNGLHEMVVNCETLDRVIVITLPQDAHEPA